MNSGRILLKGTAQKFSDAFKVRLSDYQCDDGSIAHERTGTISVPREVGTDIQGVLGLDNRPVVKPLSRQQEMAGPGPVTQKGAFYPDQVAKAYEFPTESMGAGQSVGIIELGGTLDLDDNAQYYKDHGWKLPNIQIVTVDDVKPHHESDFDEETAVDSQIIGVVAPDAKQQLIFTKKSFQGFIDGITRATNPQEGELQNSAISISYGARESDWDAQSLTNMDLALKKAALKGISILVAAGDAGAEDLNSGDRADGTFQADYPASDPWVTACGGTHLELDADGKPKEEVWNEKTFKATGGGVSHEFEKPDYQKDIQVPENPNPHTSDPKLHGVVDPATEWRGVPDVAGNAASSSGYWLRLDHKENVHYGTSAVAPLYAALVMRINGALGKPVGFLNPVLYKHAKDGVFNDVTVGNNNGFNAGPGWDATTGLGSIRGNALLAALKQDMQKPSDIV
jgi:kumamolisin